MIANLLLLNQIKNWPALSGAQNSKTQLKPLWGRWFWAASRNSVLDVKLKANFYMFQ